jgi:nucleoside-diphosphate-sugar epimerase
MNILVAGGAGFIGSNLIDDLLQKGHDVIAVDNLTTGNRENVEEFSKNPHFHFYEMGIESSEFINEFLEKDTHVFDQVYDLACPTGVPNIELLGEEMVDTCSVGTKNILKVAKKNNASFLLTSSSEVYGDPLVEPQAEGYTGNVDPQGPRANYEEGKRFSETLVALFVKKYKLNAKTVRLFNMYGPRMVIDEQRVIPRFVSQALLGEPLTVQGEGLQVRTMCYISDLIEALQLVMNKGEIGGIYNIGSDKKITMLDFAKKIIELTGSKSLISHVPRPHHDHNSRLPELEMIHGLGWKRKIELEDGLKLIIENFKKRLHTQSKSTIHKVAKVAA